MAIDGLRLQVRKWIFVVIHIKIVSLDAPFELPLCLCIYLQLHMNLLDAFFSEG